MASAYRQRECTPSFWLLHESSMMKTLHNCLAAGALALAALLPATAHSQSRVVLTEGFDDVNALPNWSFINDSNPAGLSWFQGNASIFPAQAGAADAYIAANFLSAAGGAGSLGNWLVTPALSLLGPSTLSFFARADKQPGFNDTLEVLFSSGVGLSSFELISVVGGIDTFPTSWQQFNASVDYTGTGRFAFRYTGDAAASNYIGLDTVNITTVPEPSAYLMLLVGLGGLAWLRRKFT